MKPFRFTKLVKTDLELSSLSLTQRDLVFTVMGPPVSHVKVTSDDSNLKLNFLYLLALF